MWLSWLSGRFQFKRSTVRIWSSAKYYTEHVLLLTVEKTKILKKKLGMSHRNKTIFQIFCLLCSMTLHKAMLYNSLHWYLFSNGLYRYLLATVYIGTCGDIKLVELAREVMLP